MKTLKDYKTEQMKDTEFVKEYESIQPEMDVIRAIVEARTSQNLTQKELAERTGINQADIRAFGKFLLCKNMKVFSQRWMLSGRL